MSNNADAKIFRKYIWQKSDRSSLLINFLAHRFSYFTKEEWQQKIEKQIHQIGSQSKKITSAEDNLFLKVNGTWVNSLEYNLEQGNVVETACHPSKEPSVCEDFCVLYHDNDILVTLKPPNLPVSEGGRYFYNTLVQIIRRNYTLGASQKIYTVHRIDKETSGIVIFALNQNAAKVLSMPGRLFNKQYQAIIVGTFPTRGVPISDDDTVHLRFSICKALDIIGSSYCQDYPSLRKIRMCATSNPDHENKCACVTLQSCGKNVEVPLSCVCVSQNIPTWRECAKTSHTKVRLLYKKRSTNLNLVQFTLGTGRTHQIRVHMDAIGCPVVGDKLYGQTNESYLKLTKGTVEPLFHLSSDTNSPTGEIQQEYIPNHLLHACEISLRHPITNECMTFTSHAFDSWKEHPSRMIREFVDEAMTSVY